MFLVAGGAECQAQIRAARLVPFQARLTDGAGQVLPDAVYPVTFRIYDAATGSTPCWDEVHSSVSVIGGQINVLLGSLTELDDPNNDGNTADAISFNAAAGGICDPDNPPVPPGNCACQAPGPRFLGITVGENAQEMVPRHQLVPSFHAARADTADAVRAGGVTTNMLADGVVTEQKIATGSVTGLKIADGSVSVGKLAAGLEVGAYVDGSITAADITVNDSTGLTGANIKDGSLTLADLNSLELPDLRVSVRRSTNMGMGVADTVVGWEVEEYDTTDTINPALWDVKFFDPGNSTCLVAPLTGTYVITASIGIDATESSSCVGARNMAIEVVRGGNLLVTAPEVASTVFRNGIAVAGSSGYAPGTGNCNASRLAATAVYPLVKGDCVRVLASPGNSAARVDMGSRFGMARIR